MDRMAASDVVHPQVRHLLALPKIPQKSEEWYAARSNVISASDFAQALGHGKFGTQKDLVYRKVTGFSDFNDSNPFFRWGNKYECVAAKVYSSLRGGIRIHELGLIRDPGCDFFAASPDGVCDDGTLVEIKCPMKRQITPGDEVPLQYFYQMQGQMHVCDLDRCDYIECQFRESDRPDEFPASEYEFTGSVRTLPAGGYEYGYGGDVVPGGPGTKYWALVSYNLVHVPRDPEWMARELAELKKVWDTILHYRQTDERTFELEYMKRVRIGGGAQEKGGGEAGPAASDCPFHL